LLLLRGRRRAPLANGSILGLRIGGCLVGNNFGRRHGLQRRRVFGRHGHQIRVRNIHGFFFFLLLCLLLRVPTSHHTVGSSSIWGGGGGQGRSHSIRCRGKRFPARLLLLRGWIIGTGILAPDARRFTHAVFTATAHAFRFLRSRNVVLVPIVVGTAV